MSDIHVRADQFYQYHHAGAPFIVPNPWDLGSARLLAAQGFLALATSSAGLVFAAGRPEGTLSRDEVLAHCRALTDTVAVPVTADLEDGYAEDLADVEETYRLAGKAGLVGASVEDAHIAAPKPIYDLGEAVARVEAAVAGARSLPFKFTLTARAENYLYGRPDLKDTIKRLQAYQEAGADVLYAPGLTRLEDIASVVRSVDRPVNVVVGLKNTQFSVAELAEIGVARISVGSALFRTAYGLVISAAEEMVKEGAFSFAKAAPSFATFNELFGQKNG